MKGHNSIHLLYVNVSEGDTFSVLRKINVKFHICFRFVLRSQRNVASVINPTFKLKFLLAVEITVNNMRTL